MIADLGAGTGLLTGRLASSEARVIALEPSPQMRERLISTLPDVEIRDATAERTGLEDGSASLVTAGQAYHWFDLPAALPEVHRILRRGGWFAVLWINAVESHPLQARLMELLGPLVEEAGPPGPLPGRPLARSDWFEEHARAAFTFTWMISASSLSDYLASMSTVANLPEPRRSAVLGEAAGWVGESSQLALPFEAEINLARRLDL